MELEEEPLMGQLEQVMVLEELLHLSADLITTDQATTRSESEEMEPESQEAARLGMEAMPLALEEM